MGKDTVGTQLLNATRLVFLRIMGRTYVKLVAENYSFPIYSFSFMLSVKFPKDFLIYPNSQLESFCFLDLTYEDRMI